MVTSVAAVGYPVEGQIRQGGLVLGLTSAVGVLIGLITATLAPQLATPGTTSFLWSGVVLTLAHIAALYAIGTLAASAAARRGRLKTAGFALALVGLAAQVAGEALIRFDMTLGNYFFSACMPLIGIGMILAGIAIIRTGRWSGWRRFIPLACGLYIPLVLVPAFAIAKGPSFLALAGFGAIFALLGLAMFVEASRRAA